MKLTFAVSALLYGIEASRLQELPSYNFLQDDGLSLNQRKLYAHTLQQTGSNIQLIDTDKSEEQNQREIQEMNAHLMQIARTSLDDPAEDRTQSVVKPGSEKEADLEEWLVQKRKRNHMSLAQKVSKDDPVEDWTHSAVKPGSVEEEGVTVWLAQRKMNYVQMQDDLADEYAAYAEGDDEPAHVMSKEEDVIETPNPTFFKNEPEMDNVEATLKKHEKKEKPMLEYNEYGDLTEVLPEPKYI